MHYWRDERYRIHAVLARGKTVASVPLCCSKGFFYKSYNHQLQSFFIISSSPSPPDYTTSENCRSCWRWHLLVDSNSTSYVLVKWITLIVVQLHFSHLGDAFITSDGVVRPTGCSDPGQGISAWIWILDDLLMQQELAMSTGDGVV